MCSARILVSTNKQSNSKMNNPALFLSVYSFSISIDSVGADSAFLRTFGVSGADSYKYVAIDKFRIEM